MTETEIDLQRLNKAISNGDLDAEKFCYDFFQYVHLIDDLIDTMEDGRPTMSTETILGTFNLAIDIYNGPFYLKNRHLLEGIIRSITNAYADVVLFEKAPEPEKRAIADVVRCCGNECLFMVAFICGGWDHMRKLSPMIRHRSWLLQHDPNAQQF